MKEDLPIAGLQIKRYNQILESKKSFYFCLSYMAALTAAAWVVVLGGVLFQGYNF